MTQVTPQVSKLLEQAFSLSVEEQADSLISSLGGKLDEGILAASDEEIKKRIADLDSGRAKTIPWAEVRERNLAKLPPQRSPKTGQRWSAENRPTRMRLGTLIPT